MSRGNDEELKDIGVFQRKGAKRGMGGEGELSRLDHKAKDRGVSLDK